LCNCAPSKIEGYGKYTWTKGSSERLKHIPKLPDELFEMIKVAPQPTKPTVTTTTTRKKGPLRRPQQQQQPAPPPPRSCRISSLSVVACPSPSWTTTQRGSE
ncbi:MAG: hypothetical protein ACKPKO_45690, partial [Candidatus Fonsibacter sp.]